MAYAVGPIEDDSISPMDTAAAIVKPTPIVNPFGYLIITYRILCLMDIYVRVLTKSN
jgi:hypothetical protein